MRDEVPRIVLQIVEVLGGFSVKARLIAGSADSDQELLLDELVGSLEATKEIRQRLANEWGIRAESVQTIVKLDSLGPLIRSRLQ